ncbi:MAG: DUF3027 domain-containing protein [Dactylosporangium sp.]|nr:DUF3027 domain-containing protein [Dactylosporangium sp.]NNJ63318.1 DUF3027 domain-containing protein [Dactylosporangium sp.]
MASSTDRPTVSARPASSRGGGRAARLDQICSQAVELARDAIGADPDHIGPHAGTTTEGDRLVTHQFACLLPGYKGWRWAVTVTRIARSRNVTVCETALLPGPDSLLAPTWIPWQDRLRPGDLGVGDLLPTPSDDDRLIPGYLHSDDPAVEAGLWEPGLGRARVLSREGRAEVATRWYDGDPGPGAAIALAAPSSARCGLCGFYLPLAGSLRQMFGVCGNQYAPDDGHVVSADHGCGANSEVLLDVTAGVDKLPTVYDDSEVETVPEA